MEEKIRYIYFREGRSEMKRLVMERSRMGRPWMGKNPR